MSYSYKCKRCGKLFEIDAAPSKTLLCRSCAQQVKLDKREIAGPTDICAFCGKPFVRRGPSQLYCKGPHYRICPICGKEYEEKNNENLKRPPHACSYECRAKKSKATSLEKYGCNAPGNNDEARKKAKATREAKRMKQRNCIICGRLFMQKTNAQRICENDHYSACPVCGKQIVWNSTREVEPCSKECRKELTRRKNIAKYGVEHPMQNKEVQAHHRQAMLDKYGVESPLQSEEIKQRAIQTNIERFGTEWALGNSEIRQSINETNQARYGNVCPANGEEQREQTRETMMEKYGAPTVFESAELREKVKQTMIDRYGAEHPMQVPEIVNTVIHKRKVHMQEIVDKSRETFIQRYGVSNPMYKQELVDKIADTMTERYGVKSPMLVPEFHDKMCTTYLERHGSDFGVSDVNKRFANMLNQAGFVTEFEYYVGNRRFDIHIKGTNICFEIDPTYTHNIIGNHWGSGVQSNSQLIKTRIAEENGYRCIHVFDWDNWNSVLDLVVERDSVFARKCEIFELSKQATDDFMNRFHIQKTCKGQTYSYGLTYHGELVEVITFGKPRYNRNYQFELLRLCSNPNYSVVGGASKLFKHFVKIVNPESIISYCDRSKFSGAVYEKIGMSHIRDTEPNKVWSKGTVRITDNLLRQRGFDQLFNTNYGKGTSNEELMIENGWLPVYDCGQLVYEWRAQNEETKRV